MKLLLDANLHRRIKQSLSDHEVYTVQEKGWSGISNGALIKLMLNDGIEVFITADKNLQHQQNLQKYKFAVVLLSVKSLSLDHLLPLIPKLKDALKKQLKFGVMVIE